MCILQRTQYVCGIFDDWAGESHSFCPASSSFRKLLTGKLIMGAILSLILGVVCTAFTIAFNFISGFLAGVILAFVYG
jgi:hypothetical protein